MSANVAHLNLKHRTWCCQRSFYPVMLPGRGSIGPIACPSSAAGIKYTQVMHGLKCKNKKSQGSMLRINPVVKHHLAYLLKTILCARSQNQAMSLLHTAGRYTPAQVYSWATHHLIISHTDHACWCRNSMHTCDMQSHFGGESSKPKTPSELLSPVGIGGGGGHAGLGDRVQSLAVGEGEALSQAPAARAHTKRNEPLHRRGDRHGVGACARSDRSGPHP